MTKVLIPIAIATLLAGCSPFNTVQLYRYEKDPLQTPTSFQTFMEDRDACVSKARQCIARRYKDTSYMGETVEKLLPSRGVYMGCMTQKGYFPVTHSGYVPPELVKMTDYGPGRDCDGR